MADAAKQALVLDQQLHHPAFEPARRLWRELQLKEAAKREAKKAAEAEEKRP